jgi:hypothetical protein
MIFVISVKNRIDRYINQDVWVQKKFLEFFSWGTPQVFFKEIFFIKNTPMTCLKIQFSTEITNLTLFSLKNVTQKNKNCNIRDGFEYKNPIDSTISYM